MYTKKLKVAQVRPPVQSSVSPMSDQVSTRSWLAGNPSCPVAATTVEAARIRPEGLRGEPQAREGHPRQAAYAIEHESDVRASLDRDRVARQGVVDLVQGPNVSEEK